MTVLIGSFLVGLLSSFFHLRPCPVLSCSEISLLVSGGSGRSYASLGSLLVASQWPTSIFLLFFMVILSLISEYDSWGDMTGVPTHGLSNGEEREMRMGE